MTSHAPSTEQDAGAIVAEAAARRTPLSLVGGGTKADVGRPAQTAETLSAAALTGITLYEPAEMVIGAWAGTPLSEVVRTLAEKGQELTFEPMDYRPLLGSSGEPTIGAGAAPILSGPRRLMAGAELLPGRHRLAVQHSPLALRDHALDQRLVMADLGPPERDSWVHRRGQPR